MKKIAFFLCFLFSINCFSQFSKTHYIPPLSNSNAQEPQEQFMYISCPSLTPVNFKIIELGGGIINGSVSRDNPYVLSIGEGFNTQLLVSRVDVNSVRNNKGYIIEAEDLVYVNVRFSTTPDNYQAGGVVSKGLAALGTQFRVGAFLNTGLANTNNNHYTFASVLATENNTTVIFSDISLGVTLINNAAAGSNPAPILLNRGESFVIAVEGTTVANRDGLIGTLIASDKPIAVNCGSIAGTNGDANNLDIGFDQIVSAERTGKDYIFIKGNGPDIIERPLIVAHTDNTEVYLNGDTTTPFATLDSGEYLAITGDNYTANGNLYVSTSENVFAYQGMGGKSILETEVPQANQNLCFVPPLSCQTPKAIDNIPFINQIGNDSAYTATVAVVTETGAELNFLINEIPYTITNLPAAIIATGPTDVIGNPNFVTYTFKGFTGNVSVYSTRQVYVSYFGSSGNATYGGFYSGFTFKPEIAFNQVDTGVVSGCIPNIELSVNTVTAFDVFQWYYNDTIIPGATDRTYTPEAIPQGLGPGFYKVVAEISSCNTELASDNIPVSACALDSDNDSVIDNSDIDNDNDGIPNCTESYGNIPIDLSPTSSGTVSVGTYSNPFTNANIGTTFIGNPDGSFVSLASVGPNNSVTKSIDFTNPISLVFDYVNTAIPNDLLSSEGDFVLQVSYDKTITVLNPDDQLLIDTNYDGVYESGITEFSSFEVRFRLNSGIPLAAGTGTFQFKTNLVSSFTYIHKNLSDLGDNKATFRLMASCVPKDTDNDSIPDQMDFDSDNDGIPDEMEFLGANFAVNPFTDANHNGLNDTYETNTVLDTDGDGVADYVDLDSDNDGIYDLVEAQSNAVDVNFNGMLDGNPNDFGTNGFLNSLETVTDNGILNFSIAETDGIDSIPDYIDLDSDNDTCLDVTEANFDDNNFDGKLGGNPLTVNINGVVTSSPNGYSALTNQNYITSALITINTQPVDQFVCENTRMTFTVDTNIVNSYQWQVSTDGVSFSDISDNAQYSGSTTSILTIASVASTMDGYKYRVFLNKLGNTCGLRSSSGTITVWDLPVVPANINLNQCDTDLDGITDFNLTQINDLVSMNAANETFTYFSTLNAAETADINFQITNVTNYSNSNGTTLWIRTQNANGCFSITQLNLTVSATQIPPGTSWSFYKCDDFIDVDNDNRDGISQFDFSSVNAAIATILSNNPNYTISYYKNEADALAETDAQGNSLAIIDTINYRNIGYPNQQSIWVRVDSANNNACFGLGPYISLNVEALPLAHPVTIPRACDENTNDAVINYSFDTSAIEATVLNGQTNVAVTYFDQNNNPLPSPLPNPFVTASQQVTIRLTNTITFDPDGPCFDETIVSFVVDAQPVAHPVNIPASCDDDPNNRDGFSDFDTSTIESTLLNGQNGFEVSYFAEDGSALGNQLDNPFTTATQNVTALVSNPDNPNCSASTILTFVVNPLPDVEEVNTNREIICFGVDNYSVTLNAGLQSGISSDYSYEWFRDEIAIPNAFLNNLVVKEDGIYTVKVTNYETGCYRIRTNTVVYSQIATITDVIIKDLVDNNTVTVIPSGLGTYEYSMDNPNGPFQTEPVFENVHPGFHDIYINDTNGCGMVSQSIAVVGAPRYFTPNGDSYNDTWRIKGVNPVFYKNSSVQIFDRFGKMIMEIPTGSDIGWDGTYNGNPLPADDYWYVLYLDDGRTARGHFALKR